MSVIKKITNEKFRWYFSKSSKTIHFRIAMLIIVLYRQNHRRIENLSMLFGGFLENLISIKNLN